jgi:phosphatidylglycerol:prolipoprotein diacylglycerol transferase
MIPVLFEIGPIRLHSFGLMLGIGFLLGSYILSLELRRKKLDHNIAATVTLIAAATGIAGAKVLHLIENWSSFMADPVGMAFNPGGLTWYGGFLLGMFSVILYVRKKKVPLLKFLDALGIAIMIAYGVARLGCHLAGDGDYGFPTDLPWGTNYERGTYPPSQAMAPFPEITRQYPGGVVPDNTPMHPTPVYETILGLIGFAFMWRIRTRPFPPGKMFAIYLMLSSVFRFGVEFLRLNPRLAIGLSEAQLFSIPLFLLGLFGMMYLDRKNRERTTPR